MEDLLIRQNLRWNGHLSPHEDVTRQAIQADSLFLTVIEREGAPVSGSRIPSRETRS